MLRSGPATACSLLLVLMTGCSAPPSAPPAYGAGGSPQLFDDLGPHTRAVTTKSPEAQAYFDQGLNWLYSFNHDEAVRSFTRATELDPDCAMAWWGVALARRTPITTTRSMTEERPEHLGVGRTMDQRRRCTGIDERRHRSSVRSSRRWKHRYVNPVAEDRSAARTVEYADRDGRRVLRAIPDDSDVGTLYAESMMVQHPWKLYTERSGSRPADTVTTVARARAGARRWTRTIPAPTTSTSTRSSRATTRTAASRRRIA